MMTKKLWLAALLVFAACGDGGTGPVEERPAFSADRTTYSVHEIAVLTLNGSAPAPGVDIAGTLGGMPVTLTRTADSTVVLMVPAAPGSQPLEFEAGGRTYRGTITVVAATQVADPAGYLSSLVTEADGLIAAFEADIAADTADGDDALARDMLQIARDSLASFRTLVSRLSPTEAQQVADIMNANRARAQAGHAAALAAGVVHGVANGAIPTVCRAAETALLKYKCTWTEFGLAVIEATGWLGGAYLAGKTLSSVPLVGLTVAAGLGFYGTLTAVRAIRYAGHLLQIHVLMAWEIGKAGTAALYDAGSELFRTRVIGGVAFGAGGSLPASTMTTLTSDRPISFTFSPLVRPVRASDSALPFDWLSKGLAHIARYNGIVARYGAKYQLTFASPATSWADPVPKKNISVEVVSNTRVRVKAVGGSGTRVDLTFSTAEKSPQNFTYDIIYDDDVYPPVRVRHNATLHPPSWGLATVADTAVVDTVVVYGRTRTTLLLLAPDGKLAPNEGIVPYTTATVPSHVYFQVSGNGGHYVHFEGYLTNPAMVADTFDVDIRNDLTNTKLMDVTVVMRDSAGVYGTAVLGHWTARTYSNTNNFMSQSERVRFDSNGTATIISTTYYSTNSPPVTDTTPRTYDWQIHVTLNSSGRPIHQLRRSGAGWVSYINLAYPVQSFTQPSNGFGDRVVYTRT